MVASLSSLIVLIAKKTVYKPLPSKTVSKKSSGGPESAEETLRPISETLGGGVLAGVDGCPGLASSLKKAGAQPPKARHNIKEFSPLTTLKLSSISSETLANITNLARESPSMVKLTPRLAKLVGRDNQAESRVNIMKQQLKRSNTYGRSSAAKAHVDALAAVFVHRG